MIRGLAHTEDGGQLTPESNRKRNDMISDLQRRIRTFIRPGKTGPDIIAISFTHPDRELVPKVVNQLADNYVHMARQSLDESIVGPKSFFDRKVAELAREEQKWEKAKLDFEAKHPAQLFKDPAAVETELSNLKDQLKAVETELTQAII